MQRSHSIVYVGDGRYGATVECSCGKQASGDWTRQVLEEIAVDHAADGRRPMIQSVKNVVSGDRSKWSVSDPGYPWGTNL
jgi:hypothetical protein